MYFGGYCIKRGTGTNGARARACACAASATGSPPSASIKQPRQPAVRRVQPRIRHGVPRHGQQRDDDLGHANDRGKPDGSLGKSTPEVRQRAFKCSAVRLKCPRSALRAEAQSWRSLPMIKALMTLRGIDFLQSIVAIAWKAQVRLCGRFRRLRYRGVHHNKVTAAIARELCGFVWNIGRQVPMSSTPP
jgi:hypothetical protein